MFWKTPFKNKPGDVRVVKYFALTPTELSDGYTVWLTSYYSVEMFDRPKPNAETRWVFRYSSKDKPKEPYND